MSEIRELNVAKRELIFPDAAFKQDDGGGTADCLVHSEEADGLDVA